MPTTSVAGATATANPPKNKFLQKGMKKAAVTMSGNFAKKYSETDDEFVNQFTKLGEYKKPRDYAAIERDSSILWGVNTRLAVCFIIYLRLITRIVDLFDGTKTDSVQRGAGLRHEAIVRMVWLHVNHKEVFWKNVHLFIKAGSWKDIITMLSYDLQYNGWDGRALDWDLFKQLLLAGLENPRTSVLVKKYLPRIRPNSVCVTIESQAGNMIGKWLCAGLFGHKENDSKSYKSYRQLKASGTAHQWQQLISKRDYLSLDFSTVHGRALSRLVSGKFLANQGLEGRYEQWIASKPIAKFTGFVHELFMKKPLKKYQIDTLNAQFMGLVATAKTNATTNTSMIVVRDTSGSMDSLATGVNMAAGDLAKALALFFSYMLPDGAFANSWIEFASTAEMHTWKGTTPWEKWCNDGSSYIGSTNFISVINLFCRIKSTVDESEFPTGIICISDGEFNPTQLGKTNVQVARKKLAAAGFTDQFVKDFKIVLWNVRSGYYGPTTGAKFETYESDVPNVYYFTGFDASIMAFLTGIEGKEASAPKNAVELFLAAMDQELLRQVEI